MSRIVQAMLAALMVLGSAAVSSQQYPNKAIRIVTALPGGSSDFNARVIAQSIAAPLGRPVIVDNRATTIMAEVAANAAPDGYTLLLATPVLWIQPMFSKVSYDPVRDFAPVSLVSRDPLILVVPVSSQAKSVRELIELARSKPGALNYAAGSQGAPTHQGGELLKALAEINIVYVPYKSSGPAMIGLLAGEAHMMLDVAGQVVPHVKAGKLRPLAITSAKPSALFPELPTVAMTLPGFEVANMNALFAPASTPATIIRRLNREVIKALAEPEVKEKYRAIQSEVVGSSPEELGATVKSETARWGGIFHRDLALTR